MKGIMILGMKSVNPRELAIEFSATNFLQVFSEICLHKRDVLSISFFGGGKLYFMVENIANNTSFV